MTEIIKKDDLQKQLTAHGYQLHWYQRRWKVAPAQPESDYYNCTPVFVGETKEQVQHWINGYTQARRDIMAKLDTVTTDGEGR